jgi:hypothetical protein
MYPSPHTCVCIHLLRELVGASLTVCLSKAVFNLVFGPDECHPIHLILLFFFLIFMLYMVSGPDECHPIHLPPRPPSVCMCVYRVSNVFLL